MSWSGYVPASILRELIEDPEAAERFRKTMLGEEEDDVRADVPQDQHALEA